MKTFCFALLSAVLCASVASAAGMAGSDNFVVYTPDQPSEKEEQCFANLVLQRAEMFRKEIAVEWLGEQLPNGAGESVIYVDFSTKEDRGLTWAKDHPDRIFHNIFLTTSPECAVGSTLHHEITHTVFATRYPHPNRLPEWVEEGIATRYDDTARQAAREQLVAQWVRSGRYPDIANLFATSDVKAHDETCYAVANSLVSFLVDQRDERTVVRFAEIGKRTGWDVALQSQYGFQSVSELQSQWQDWLKSNSAGG